MATVDLNAVSAILKKDIYPALVDAVKQETLLYQIAKKSFKPQHLINNKFYVPVKLELPAGYTSWGETGTPTVNKGAVQPVQAVYGITQKTASFQIDKITLDSGKGAVIDTLESQATGIKDLLTRMLNFELWFGNGSNPIFYANGAGTNSTTLVIDTNRAQENGDIDYATYIPVGSTIKVGTNSPVTVVAHPATNTLTLSTAITWADDAAIQILDADGNPQTYLTGLLTAIGTGEYAGIDPATYSNWKSYVDSPATATTLTLSDIDKAHINANQFGKVKYTIANKTLYNKFLSLLTANRQVQVTEKPVFNGGWTGVSYMGHDFILDYDCPSDTVFHITPNELALAELAPIDFLKGNDGSLFKAYGKTLWESTLYTSLQLVTFNRRAHAKIEKRTA
ncbi:MAG: phage major capsid protein [Thermoprotei archaeon]